jgi:hypothetical protein
MMRWWRGAFARVGRATSANTEKFAHDEPASNHQEALCVAIIVLLLIDLSIVLATRVLPEYVNLPEVCGLIEQAGQAACLSMIENDAE